MGFGGTSGGRTAHISPSQSSRCEQLKAPPWQTLGRQKHVFRRLHALLHPPPPQPDHGPHQRVQFWVSTVPEGSSWACSAGVKVRPQGRESWTQGHAAGGTHMPSCSSWGGVGSSYARTTASRPPHPTPAVRESRHSARTYPLSRAAAARPAGLRRAEGARPKMQAEARARGGAGPEHLARWALWGQCTGSGGESQGGGCPGLPPALANASCDGALSSAALEGRTAPHGPGTHQGRAAGYIPAAAPCPGPGMVSPQGPRHSSDGAQWCPNHREPSSGSRRTTAQGLGTHGVGTPGTR